MIYKRVVRHTYDEPKSELRQGQVEVERNKVESEGKEVNESKTEDTETCESQNCNESVENDYHAYLKQNRKSVKPIELRNGQLLFECEDLYNAYVNYCGEQEEAPMNYRNFKKMLICKDIKFSQKWFDGKRRNCYSINRSFFVD